MPKIQQGVNIHIETPTLDRMLVIKDESQKVGNFIEWLAEKGYVIARYGSMRNTRDTLMPDYQTTEKRLAEYFGIDLDEAERERLKILKGLRI